MIFFSFFFFNEDCVNVLLLMLLDAFVIYVKSGFWFDLRKFEVVVVEVKEKECGKGKTLTWLLFCVWFD
jgi:hypothetical protein